MRITLTAVLPVALAAGLLAASLGPAGEVVDQPWGTDCSLAWCEPTPAPVVDGFTEAMERATAVAKLSDETCTTPEAWTRGQIPGTMIVTTDDGAVQRRPWTYPAPDGVWVERLCR